MNGNVSWVKIIAPDPNKNKINIKNIIINALSLAIAKLNIGSNFCKYTIWNYNSIIFGIIKFTILYSYIKTIMKF